MYIMIAFGFLAYAWWTKSTFWQTMAGFVSIAAGIEFIAWDPVWVNTIIGAAVIMAGLYELIMVAVSLFRGD